MRFVIDTVIKLYTSNQVGIAGAGSYLIMRVCQESYALHPASFEELSVYLSTRSQLQSRFLLSIGNVPHCQIDSVFH